IARLTDSIAAREKVIALTRERVDMRELVQTRGAGSRAQTIDALERHQAEVTTQVGERGQLRESTAALQATEKTTADTVAQFVPVHPLRHAGWDGGQGFLGCRRSAQCSEPVGSRRHSSSAGRAFELSRECP